MQNNSFQIPDSITYEEFNLFLEDIEGSMEFLTEEQLNSLSEMISKMEEMHEIEKARTDFLSFIKLVKPELFFSSKGQHAMLADAFERMVDGDLDRLTISMPPRFGKSEFGSICLVAWFIGKNPKKKVLQASAVDTLAIEFGRQVKNIIDSAIFRRIFPGVTLSKDSKSNGKFATNQGGQYFAVGVNTGVAGRGGDLIVCDDIVNEQDAKSGKPEAYDSAWTWFLSGPQQRLQPGGRIVIIGTRWSKADPIGRVKRRAKEEPGADIYESIEFAALDEKDESNFPEMWSSEKLRRTRANSIPHLWNAQYMQNPTTASGAIVSKHMWQKWSKSKEIGFGEVEYVPPVCNFTMIVLDTAFTANKRSNPTALTVWGGFTIADDESGEEDIQCIILLYCEKKKMEFQELKKQAKIWTKNWEPDVVLIEDKSSGPMLRSELNQAGIFVTPVTPKPHEDKVSRLHSITGVFAAKRVYYMPTYANEACIEEVNDFPNGAEDDYTDTVAYAIRHFRSGGMVKAEEDQPHDRDIGDDTIVHGSHY